MPLDALCLSALTQELSPCVLGARIDKIQQPAADEIVIILRGQSGSMRLLLSASPARARAQITETLRENPQQAPMFCMLLRKHLSGGRIVKLEQPPLERLLRFEIEVTDDLGDRVRKTLILEAMGRHANLILLDADGRIVDCLRRVSQDISAERQLLPGMFYRLPALQEKCNLATMSAAEKAQLLAQIPEGGKAAAWLLAQFGGISPLLARELCFLQSSDTETVLGAQAADLMESLTQLMARVAAGETQPTMLLRDGKIVDFSFLPILQYGPSTQLRHFETYAQLLDAFYTQKEGSERIRQKGQDLHRSLVSARDRVARKLGYQRKELLDTQYREALRERGDLLTANLYRIEKGMEQITLENYYDPDGGTLEIKLDPRRTPQENAARYYKDYRRAKTAQTHLTEQIKKGEAELFYLQSVLESFARAEGEADLEEIRRELEGGGYLRRRHDKSKPKPKASKFLEFRSDTGFRISVGRNNMQNDALTCKLAARSDLWFHVQSIHGAHVILWTEGRTVDAASMTQAALLAAYYSQAREGVKVAVDYTPVRIVKKPAGAKPGMVIYHQYETAYVTPDVAVIEAIAKA